MNRKTARSQYRSSGTWPIVRQQLPGKCANHSLFLLTTRMKIWRKGCQKIGQFYDISLSTSDCWSLIQTGSEPTQPPVQYAPRAPSRNKVARGVKLPKSRVMTWCCIKRGGNFVSFYLYSPSKICLSYYEPSANWRFGSSGMRHCVVGCAFPDVLKDCYPFLFGVKEVQEEFI
jgi:hypothetical protein